MSSLHKWYQSKQVWSEKLKGKALWEKHQNLSLEDKT
jgi:hypothetical protein